MNILALKGEVSKDKMARIQKMLNKKQTNLIIKLRSKLGKNKFLGESNLSLEKVEISLPIL